jgi:hypothetical protein
VIGRVLTRDLRRGALLTAEDLRRGQPDTEEGASFS